MPDYFLTMSCQATSDSRNFKELCEAHKLYATLHLDFSTDEKIISRYNNELLRCR